MTSFISIPFKTEAMSGISQVEGIGKFSPAGVVLEFEAKILGLVRTGVKEARLPLADILDIKFKKGFFKLGAKIEIRLKSFTKLNELPYEDGKIKLKIRREDHQRAEEAVKTLQRYLDEATQTLPSAQISVNDLFEDETEKLELKIKK
jgi:hypothetical protein